MAAIGQQEALSPEKEYDLKFSYLNSPLYFPAHWHEFAEFILATDDACRYIVNDIPYTLNAGDLLLIWPAELHSVVSVPAGSSIIMQFGGSFIFNRHDLSLYYRYLRLYHKIGIKEMPELNRSLAELLAETYRIFTSADPFAETNATIRIYSMLISLASYALKDASPRGRSYDPLDPTYIKLRDACAFISRNCDKNLSQKEVAHHFGFSHFYFSRLFKEYSSVSFNEYLTKERMQRATQLLCEESIPITEVAYRSGFQSISNFNRVFRETTHHTPMEYRRMYNDAAATSTPPTPAAGSPTARPASYTQARQSPRTHSPQCGGTDSDS